MKERLAAAIDSVGGPTLLSIMCTGTVAACGMAKSLDFPVLPAESSHQIRLAEVLGTIPELMGGRIRGRGSLG